ncbi:energy transducer TonB family protein [Salegentibacter chungangensis]|uniref:Energy transducer TonB n=1 Tax=Salegentibacter chungangensis TaxID=1335724 RepID=A0ABW3NPY6_9FLAO
MDFFDRHKALILTVLTCSVLILALYNFQLSKKQEKANEMLVNLDQFVKEQAEAEEKPEEKEPARPAPKSPETHRAFNENQEARQENFDRQLNEIFEKNSAESEAASENEASEGDYSISKAKKAEKKKSSDGNDASEKISKKSGGLRNSSISFSLKGRSAIDIPNPVYTCDTPGKVVINIEVDSNGRVTETSYNKASSGSSNECLIEQALEYAQGARFSSLPGRDSQPGTITYNFKP